MKVELSWTLSEDYLEETNCCVCHKKFQRGVLEANLLSDAHRLHLGEVCPDCLSRGPEYLGEKMRSYLRFSSRITAAQADMEAVAAEEGLECPSYEDFKALEASVGGPRYCPEEE